MPDDAFASQRSLYDPLELRTGALDVLARSTLFIAYVWQLWALLMSHRFHWGLLLPGILGAGALGARSLASRFPRCATWTFLLGMGVSALGSTWLYGLSWALHFAIPTIVFAGVLLNPLPMFLVASSISGAIIATDWFRLGQPPALPTLASMIALLMVTALALWLSSSNLYTALQWAMQSYTRALEESRRAQERQGELRRALKSLDEASSRLQWMNFELARARDAAEELRRLKQQFVANVSHELRTPLALITGFSEMMYLCPESYGAPLPAAYVGDAREIYNNSRHLLSLVDDILDLSRVSVGRMILSRQRVSPERIIYEAVDTIRPLIEGKGLELKADIERPLPTAFLDPTRVRQVLLNLLNNARRFTEHGTITVRAQLQGDSLLVTVSDTGIGVAPSDQALLFQEYRQLDGSLMREHDGTGLGLALSKEFVSLHGGRIWVDSEGTPGRGSTFCFTLPLQEPEAPESALRHLPRQAGTKPIPRLLVTGGHEEVVRTLQRQLDGYELTHVHDFAAVPEMLESLQPAAILVDSVDSQPLEPLFAVRDAVSNPELPIISFPFGGDRLLARSLGVQGYIVKPMRRAVFLEALASLGADARRILVVDDDARFVRLVARFIQSTGRPYEVLRAYNGEDGMSRLHEGGVDAIVLDLFMPEMDGYTFLKRVRSDKSFSHIPILVVTGRGYDVRDSHALSGNVIAIEYGRGISNEESLAYLRAILETAQSEEFIVASSEG